MSVNPHWSRSLWVIVQGNQGFMVRDHCERYTDEVHSIAGHPIFYCQRLPFDLAISALHSSLRPARVIDHLVASIFLLLGEAGGYAYW